MGGREASSQKAERERQENTIDAKGIRKSQRQSVDFASEREETGTRKRERSSVHSFSSPCSARAKSPAFKSRSFRNQRPIEYPQDKEWLVGRPVVLAGGEKDHRRVKRGEMLAAAADAAVALVGWPAGHSPLFPFHNPPLELLPNRSTDRPTD